VIKRASPILLIILIFVSASCNTNNANKNINGNSSVNASPKSPDDAESAELAETISGFRRRAGFYSALDKYISGHYPGYRLHGLGEMARIRNTCLFYLDLTSEKGDLSSYCLGRCLSTREGKTYWFFEQVDDDEYENLKKIAALQQSHITVNAESGE
jgi:hypothetical protein